MRPVRSVTALLAAGAVAALGACSPQDRTPEVPVCTVRPAADLVPERGMLFGVNLDWDAQSLADYTRDLGRRPAVVVSFTSVPLDDADVQNVTWAADQVRAEGGILLLTLEPDQGLAAVTPDVVDRVADLLASFNGSGVPVIVRFAHEMNGSWYAWGQQPEAYVRAFREVAAALDERAPGSAMMWAPNYAGGYPFVGGAFAAQPGTPGTALLDTDGDGSVTAADDAYAPYYPGDDVVDWVGMSLYHWGSAPPWGETEMPEPGKFAAQLTGTYDGLAGDETSAPDFYQVYGVEHGKPVAIPETAALVVTDDTLPWAQGLAVKQAWWHQVLAPDLATTFPQLKMVNWFEWDKHETEIGAHVDWTAAGHPALRDAFVADLPGTLVLADAPVPCVPVGATPSTEP
ncbi:glycoside hydrolase family 26 protein [Cellulomonas sp. NPDC055163]